MKRTSITIPIYERTLILIITDDVAKATAKIDSTVIEDEDETEIGGRLIHDSLGRMVLILLPDTDINTICHESFHIVRETLDDAGMELTDSSEEAYAYLIGWVGEKIHKAIKKYNN